MDSKVHPAIHLSNEMRKQFLKNSITAGGGFEKRVQVHGVVGRRSAIELNQSRSRVDVLAGADLALLAIFQMLRTGLLRIPALARYMQLCRRTRDNSRTDMLWRLFVRARYPNHPFERDDRVPLGFCSSIDPRSIRIDEVEHRTFPCSTQLNACNLRGRNDFKIVCTTEQSLAIMRGAKNHVAFAGGLFPFLFKTATKKERSRTHARVQERGRRRKPRESCLNNNLVIIDLCRPYLVQTFTAKSCNSRDSLRALDADQAEPGHSFWSGRTESFDNLIDYRMWWCRMQVCAS